MSKMLWAGQISSLFGALILSLRHFYVMPAKDYPFVLLALLIGFIPSLLIFHIFANKFTSYMIVSNVLALVSIVYFLMEETALSGIFLLVPVFSLFFKNKKLYFFSAINSIVVYLVLTEESETPAQLVILIDHMTIFLIMVFLIFLVVNELIQNTQNETKQIHTIMSLSRSVEAKGSYTKGHSERVATLSLGIANFIPEINKDVIYQTGVIHDVGKLATPDYILLKKGRLTGHEYNIMKKHTIEGARICRSLGIADEFVMGVLHHHERWDGKGYPKGLKGDDIPLIARILSIADAIDAMSSNRAYRSALDFEMVRSEVEKGNGTQSDSVITKIVLENWEDLLEIHKENLVKDKELGELESIASTN